MIRIGRGSTTLVGLIQGKADGPIGTALLGLNGAARWSDPKTKGPCASRSPIQVMRFDFQRDPRPNVSLTRRISSIDSPRATFCMIPP